MSTASKNRSRGFTLLEVLVATAILGGSVAALLGVLSGALGNMQKLRGPSQALLLGQSLMNQILTTGLNTNSDAADSTVAKHAIPLDQKIAGRWDNEYRWEALATRFNPPEQVASGQPIMVRIVLDVFWRPSPDKQEKKLSIETYQLQKEPPRPAQ